MMKNRDHKYLPALDGIRAIAILFVVISHYGLGHIIPGGFGVTLFFYISGLLITKLLLEEFNQTGDIKMLQFYMRRFFRLYPALIFFLIIVITFMAFGDCNIKIIDILSVFFYFRNYYINMIYWQELLSHTKVISDFDFLCSRAFNIAWSLAIEEHFYIFYPFVILISLKRNVKLIFIFLIFSIFVVLMWRIFILKQWGLKDATIEIIYHGTDTRFDSIAFGCLSAYFMFFFEKKHNRYLDSYVTFTFGILIILLTLMYREAFFRSTFRYSLQGVAFMLLIPSIIYNRRFLFIKAILENKSLVYIGKLSYSLYLCHWIGVYFAERLVGFQNYCLNYFLVAIPVGLSFTFVSYHIVETRFLKLRKKYGANLT